MLQHFSYKPMFAGVNLPGWTFSFFYQNQRYSGDYMPHGTINWDGETPSDEEKVKKMIHELMTFHVYE
ncbi:YheE family protein [Sporosarcina thermotolerans]|uniref:YheE family protein n=1 Tax=Sporosarcina thermotolerans TaxID=633404 RepID=A0AAW9ABC2_9BACL|nr:YheE family protein [Sporosarcina thermotolerans]MDW0118344.1 YheE family protein [Sporosarcina thermotolerans]WHT49396.1 YheE family protein [Sporosarcina thermotolerans]